jgi:hypothetical protein
MVERFKALVDELGGDSSFTLAYSMDCCNLTYGDNYPCHFSGT